MPNTVSLEQITPAKKYREHKRDAIKNYGHYTGLELIF